MPEPNGRAIFNEPIEVKCSAFHGSATYQTGLFGRKNFGINPLDFGTKCPASITEALTPTEVSSLRHGADSTHVRPEAGRFFCVAGRQDSKER